MPESGHNGMAPPGAFILMLHGLILANTESHLHRTRVECGAATSGPSTLIKDRPETTINAEFAELADKWSGHRLCGLRLRSLANR